MAKKDSPPRKTSVMITLLTSFVSICDGSQSSGNQEGLGAENVSNLIARFHIPVSMLYLKALKLLQKG